MVVDELIIDGVKKAPKWKELGHNIIFLKGLVQVRRKVPARLLGGMNHVALPRLQRRVQMNGRRWDVCR